MGGGPLFYWVTTASCLFCLALLCTSGVVCMLIGLLEMPLPCPLPRQVCSWFAARCDLILLLFDPYKLDISDEFKSVRAH